MTATNSSLYGKGIFTTVAIRDGVPFLWKLHWRRLLANAETVGIDLVDFSESFVSESLAASIKENRIYNGRARITLYDETPSEIWRGNNSSGQKTTLSIIAGERRQIPQSFKLTVSPYPVNSRSPLAGVKSCNYLEQIMSFDKAKTRGFDEAIRLNERGHITSACMANIFWLSDGKLFTPSLSTGCLAGTTREFVLENLECIEVETEIVDLHKADAIFLTSAGLGVVRVKVLDGQTFDLIDHPILHLVP